MKISTKFRGGILLCVLCAIALAYHFGHSPQERKPSGFFGNIFNISTGDDAASEKDAHYSFESAPEQSNLNAQQKRGREIWFKATGGNDRFHAYVIAQKVGDHAMDFGRILQSERRNTRFDDWGLMNDPECCHPGDVGCPARSLAETYGFDWCPGDEELLKHVGDKTESYHDAACDLDKAPGAQSSCNLRFGTSAGAVGFRKFPNPRFNADKWAKLTGDASSWTHYMDHNDLSDANHLGDGSVEPPFRVGIACASCHAAFDPVHPPRDLNHPKWENISGLVGNQYMYTSQIFGSGFAQHSLQWQLFTNIRPGTVDTSAVPDDQVNNPGTMNAIINFEKRPTFSENVDTWRPVSSCPAGSDSKSCSCIAPGSRCYQRSVQQDTVLHILKGGEDSVGPKNALLRVHVNIGVCAEQCWMNHLTDLEVLDPSQRQFGQTPFDVGQCRRDCPEFRALEDRMDDELAFVLTGRPFELYQAKKLSSPAELETKINEKFGAGKVAQGRQVFAQNCAHCHSSNPSNPDEVDPQARDANGVRVDWLGSDERIPAVDVGTYECRSLHSNHMSGHVWDIFASNDYKAQSEVKGLSGEATGGRGHYRAISLLSIWATAPFMHNNAVGPEICGKHPNSKDVYLQVSGSRQCEYFDPSVEGRVKLFEDSMYYLLHPEARGQKQTLTTDEIDFPITPSVPGHSGLTLVIPKGLRASRVVSFRHKDLVADFRNYMIGKTSPTLTNGVRQVFDSVMQSYHSKADGRVLISDDILVKLGSVYSSCTDTFEDKGHTFGSGADGKGLTEDEKQALTAFMETL